MAEITLTPLTRDDRERFILDDQFPEGMFRFEKRIGPARGDTVTFSAPSAAGAVTAKLKDGAYSASCSSTLIPGEGGYTLFWYFPPKSGKFAGDGGREFVK